MELKSKLLIAWKVFYNIIGRPVVSKGFGTTGFRKRYIILRRLTLKTNPAIYKWLWWNFTWNSKVG